VSNPEESETTVVLRDGQLVLPDRIVRGDLLLEGAVIRSLAPAGTATGDEIWDLGGRKVTPGWIDTHIHGFDGVDFNAADPETLAASIEKLALRGVTTVYPTIVPGPEEPMKETLATVARAAEISPSILGIHLEGPFLSPGRRGALPESGILEYDDELMNRLLEAAGGRLRVMTFAPERVPLAAQKKFSMVGVRGSIGHTCATSEETTAAIDAGARRCTHLCNAMPPMHHRDPGPVGTLLMDDRVRCEVILDGHHLSDDLVRLALKLKGPGGLMAVSDAMPLAGMGVASGTFCGQEVCSDGHRATLSDGTLAGSVTLLPEALSRTSESLGLDEVSLQNLGSQNAAEDLGLPRRGSLRTDYRADLVIHGDSGIEAVMRGGLSVEDADGPRLPASIEQIR
jgi:N-acetylglucosamine-6-phosphate deacetylase